MENPQPEKGHIDIANEIVDHLSSYHLSGNEWMILWVVLRKTWGWHKKEDAISLTQFEKTTHLSRPSVKEALNKLVGKKVLVVGKKVLGINTYSFNKLYSQWVVGKKVLVGFSVKLVPKKVLPLVGKKEHTKETITKETITKEIDILRNISREFGNSQINECRDYFLKVFQIPKEDGSVRWNRIYWKNLIKASKTGISGVKWLIDMAVQDEFLRPNITSGKALFNKQVMILSRRRGNMERNKIAVNPAIQKEAT
jgi:phage replication O-like protein O